MNYELDFALEQKVRDIPNMSRADLVSFLDIMVEYNRETRKVLGDFQSLINQQGLIITELSTRLLQNEPNN
jgi:hypothetical protein